MSPSIPELPDDILGAALAYAAAGWYVLPVDPGTKHPGSVVGKRWQEQSSRDREVIIGWFAGSSHALALHVGRSGAVAFDVDDPASLPPTLALAIASESPPYQSTRPDVTGRGHYLFAAEAGTIGNSGGDLGSSWGEVRGFNGIIVVEPSKHSEHSSGGLYTWQRRGALPEPPSDLVTALRPPSQASANADSGDVGAFLSELPDGSCGIVEHRLSSALTTLEARTASRHDTARDTTLSLCALGDMGHRGVSTALESLRDGYMASVVGSDGVIPPERIADWNRMLTGAVDTVTAEPTDPGSRSCCDNPFAGILPAVGETGSSPPGHTSSQPDSELTQFWQARGVLSHIHDAAKARMVGPWALLGVTLVRAVCAVEPYMKLPAIIGAAGSLNLFCGLVGKPGAGKSAVMSAARDVISFGREIEELPIGTGEGAAAAYVQWIRDDEGELKLQMFRWRALFTASEIGMLGAIGSRSGSTLLPVLRAGWSGETLGNQNAEQARRRIVNAHSYRMGLVAGIQPALAGPLLDDVNAGTPQRFLWMPAHDMEPETDLAQPGQWQVDLPQEWRGVFGMTEVPDFEICTRVRNEIKQDRVASLRGEVEAGAAHVMQARLKAAAGLALLSGRAEVTDEDWDLAHVLLRMSGAQQEHCRSVISAEADKANEAAGRREAKRAAVVEDHQTERTLQRVTNRIAGNMNGEWTSQSDIRRSVASRDKQWVPEALERLVSNSILEVQDSVYQGQPARHYRRAS